MLEIYELTDFNSVGTNNKKKQIILTETGRNYKDYINGLKYRYNKKNPFVPNYIVNKEGVIYKTLKDNQYSTFMEDEKVDKKVKKEKTDDEYYTVERVVKEYATIK